MKPKNPPSPPNQRERWMVSYVDVLSILLIFFMVAAARNLPVPSAHAAVTVQPSPVRAVPLQSAERSQAEMPAVPAAAELPTVPALIMQAPIEMLPAPAVAEPIADRKEGVPPAEREVKRHRAILIRAEERLKEKGLEPKLEPRGLVISVPQVVLFSSGEDTVNPRAFPTIAQIADVLRDIPNEVRLIGHADTVPVHNRRFRSNWDLSMARSEKILELLSGRYGISESRLSIASYGPWRPTATNDTPTGRGSNRRVEIVILDESDSVRAQVE